MEKVSFPSSHHRTASCKGRDYTVSKLDGLPRDGEGVPTCRPFQTDLEPEADTVSVVQKTGSCYGNGYNHSLNITASHGKDKRARREEGNEKNP
uniref:Uncharacterized protein n=1 Tax=Sphaerodactylus townsendi TaxID=933632 RepID=A0ACB8FWM5_9SAUR